MRYFLSAGEASGDLHAAHLIAAIREHDREAEFAFLGGDLMAQAAECEPVIHYRRMAYMGFSEVLRHWHEILSNFSCARQAISQFLPDALILVDYPSFNLKLASYARSLGIPVYYYIAPKVWAWKEWRVREIKRTVRRIYSILPFEVPYFRTHGVDVDYVGNPSVEEVDAKLAENPGHEYFCRVHSLPPKPIIAIVPGSRKGEIRNNLPVMDAVSRMHPDYQGVIAGAPNIDEEFYAAFSSLPVVKDATFDLMAAADAALVTSGTATLECALIGTPQVVCYRANGSRLSYNIMKHLIKAPFVALPNLIANSEVIPEMLLHMCTPEAVNRELSGILPGRSGRKRQLEGYELMRANLGTKHAAENAASLLCADIRQISSRHN